MPSKYGFSTLNEIKAAQDVRIEKGKKEAVRINPIVRDVLEDYKKAKGLEYPITCKVRYTGEGKADRYEQSHHFGTWELGNYYDESDYDPCNDGTPALKVLLMHCSSCRSVSLHVSGSWGLRNAAGTIEEVLKRALGYSNTGNIFNINC